MKCSVGKGENETLCEKFIWVVKWWEVKGWGESVSTICVEKNTRNYIQYFLALELFTFSTCCILICLVCIAAFTLDAGLLSRSQYSQGPATGYLDAGFSWFPSVYKQMLRWFPRFQVATTCFSCSPPELNLLVTNFIFCVHVEYPLPPGDNPIAVNNNNKKRWYQ